jgi:hypothetical protein
VNERQMTAINSIFVELLDAQLLKGRMKAPECADKNVCELIGRADCFGSVLCGREPRTMP